MTEVRVHLYYLGKGRVRLDIEGPETFGYPELRDHYDQVKVGILSQFGGETRFERMLQ
jgi:hypothetical protein